MNRGKSTGRLARGVGLLPLAIVLGQCVDEAPCASSSLAFLLPAEGDEIAFHTRLCVEPTDGTPFNAEVWASLADEYAPAPHRVAVVIDDPANTATDDGFVEIADRHCDPGVRMVLRRELDNRPGPAVGWLSVQVYADETHACTISVSGAP